MAYTKQFSAALLLLIISALPLSLVHAESPQEIFMRNMQKMMEAQMAASRPTPVPPTPPTTIVATVIPNKPVPSLIPIPVAPPNSPVTSTITTNIPQPVASPSAPSTTQSVVIPNVPVLPILPLPPAPVAPPLSATTSTYITNISVSSSTAPISTKMPVIVGVYEGSYPAGIRHSFGYHPEGTVTVTLQGRASDPAQPLVLTSYEPVNWVIKNPNGVRITSVIATGYYAQRVTNAPAPVQYFSQQAGTGYQYAYAYRDANYQKLVGWLSSRFGFYDSGVFYGSYSGSAFTATMGYKG